MVGSKVWKVSGGETTPDPNCMKVRFAFVWRISRRWVEERPNYSLAHLNHQAFSPSLALLKGLVGRACGSLMSAKGWLEYGMNK